MELRFGVRRSVVVGCVIVLAAALAVESRAWACTGHPGELHFSVDAAAPGESVMVTGSLYGGFYDTSNVLVNAETVELHWGAPDGPILATATGPSFAVPITIPEAAAGWNAVDVVAWSESHRLVENGEGASAFPFIVTSGASDGQQPGLVRPARPGSLVGAVDQSPSAPVGSPEPASAQAADSSAPGSTTASPATAALAGPATARAAGPSGGAVPTPASAPVAVSPAPSGQALQASVPESDEVRALTRTVWSTSGSGYRTGSHAPAVASLANAPAAVSGRSTPAAAVGLALLAVGLLVLAGGAGVAMVGRRRAKAVAGD
ncbi:MAG TPA: hypothetical protein VFJ85_17060 [Acidimicrobiales bacterium]|nr:hypothetical protein [Acidimicrobiales bacterium]